MRPTSLESAYQSLLLQDYDDWEWVVVIDGSSEAYPSNPKMLHDSRVRIYSDGVHRGKGGARNMGLRHIRGDWVGFLDDDDEYLSHHLDTFRASILANDSKEAIYRSKFFVVTDSKVKYLENSIINTEDPWIYYLFAVGNIMPWFAPKDWAQSLLFSEHSVFQDAHYFLRLALKIDIIKINDATAIYNLNGVSSSAQLSKASDPGSLLEEELDALADLFEYDHPKISDYKNRGIYQIAKALRYIHHASAVQSTSYIWTVKSALTESRSWRVWWWCLKLGLIRLIQRYSILQKLKSFVTNLP